MTEPDEALLWARGDWAKGLKSKGARNDAHQGLWDECLDDAARGYRAGAAASAARIKALEDVLLDVSVSLIAAISLLEGGGKKAAASDKMFAIMLSDYQASVSRARALLKETNQ